MSQSANGRREPYIGRSLPRFEDLRLVRGQGRYTDDVSLPDQVYAAFVRSPHPHARIVKIDTAPALAVTGVIAVLTADGFCGPGVKHRPNPADAVDIRKPAFDGSLRPVVDEPQLPLAKERVTYVGDPIATVIATTARIAQDACEQVLIEYEALPAVVDGAEALKPGAPTIL